MKDKILDIMSGFAAPCAYGITASDASLAAKEVAAHILEFIEWFKLSDWKKEYCEDEELWIFKETIYGVTNYYEFELNDVYKWWLNNVKK